MASTAYANSVEVSETPTETSLRLHYLGKRPYAEPVSNKAGSNAEKWEGTSEVITPEKNNLHMIGKQPFRTYK